MKSWESISYIEIFILEKIVERRKEEKKESFFFYFFVWDKVFDYVARLTLHSHSSCHHLQKARITGTSHYVLLGHSFIRVCLDRNWASKPIQYIYIYLLSMVLDKVLLTHLTPCGTREIQQMALTYLSKYGANVKTELLKLYFWSQRLNQPTYRNKHILKVPIHRETIL